MFPDNELSDPTMVAGFNFPVKSLNPADMLQDWEMGGVALNDPSQGLEVQLWRFSLTVDESTGDSDVYVEAPSVPKTLLFSGSYINEIAGCFDQNMNPMVAYQEGGDPKIWWWDSTANAMVHTTLPSGCIDLRCTLDDKRQFNVADSDIVLSYVRGGALYYRYQRERYLTEHLLFNAGSIERLVSLAMNEQWRLQWRLRGQSSATNALSVSEPYLGDIVYDLCRQSGILPQNINVSDLYRTSDIVPGMKVAVNDGLDKPIDWLREIYQFDKSQYNRKLNFAHRGREITFRIPYADLVTTGNKQALAQTKVNDKELPRKVNVNHIDSTGGFARNKQTATRRSNLITTDEETTIESQVVLTPDQAATAALTIIKAKYGEQWDYKFSTTIKYSEVTPGDVGEVQDAKGTWYRVRIEEKNEDSGVIDWEAKQDAGTLTYGAFGAPGNSLDPPVSTTPGLVGDTILDIINFPVQRDQDDELGLYIAARGESDGWSGYTLFYSTDAGATYFAAYTASTPSNIGETATSLTEAGTSVEVLVPYSLVSVTADQVTAGYNRAVIGDEEIQFRTATLLGMVDGQYHYLLEHLERGVLRTINEDWAAGIRFIFLDESIIFAQIQRQFYGQDIYYKAVSFGQSLDDVTPVAFLFDFAFSQTEWAVSDVVVEPNPDGEGAKISWTPAPRLGTFGPAPYESKYFRGYRLKFGDGFIVDVPPGTTSYIYADAYDAGGEVTVEVWSLNEITGECAWVGGTGSGGGGGEEPGGGTAPPPVTISATGGPASTTLGPNGGYADDTPYPIPQPTTLGSNVIANPDFSSPGLADWKQQNGSALDSRWSNTSNKLRFEGTGAGDKTAYNYGAFYSVPIWPFARYTFTVSGKVQCITPGVQVALGVARGFSTAGGGIPTYSVDTITSFAEYVSETTISKAYTHTIDVAGKTLAGQYVIGTFMPVLIVRSTTGETQVVTLDDVSMVITEYMPAMTELFLDNIDFPADDQTGWNRFPYVSGLSAELTFVDGYVHFVPTDQYAIHSYMFNLDKLNNHASWATGHRVRIKWKSWCDDPTAYGYITTNGSAACIGLRASGDTPPDSVPGWQAALMRGDYTEYEFWMEMPGDSSTFDAYLGVLMKTIVGKEVRCGDFRIWITDAVEP